MERIVDITPAFDKRNPDPKKNYGIHCCDLRMVLLGEMGAVQFVLSTGWMLPEVAKEMKEDIKLHHFYPLPMDLGYHSYKPLHEWQESTANCPYLKGPCYYDGSGLNAVRIYEVLVRKGSEEVWSELKKYYDTVFELK